MTDFHTPLYNFNFLYFCGLVLGIGIIRSKCYTLHNYTGCIILITGVLIPCLQLVDTIAYKLQLCLSNRVVVDGHGCHTALHFSVNAKENQDKSSYVVPVI